MCHILTNVSSVFSQKKTSNGWFWDTLVSWWFHMVILEYDWPQDTSLKLSGCSGPMWFSWVTEDSWMRGHSTSLHDWDSVHFLQYAEEIKWLFILSSTIVQCLWIARRPPVFCSPEYYCVVSISSSLTFKKEECKSSESKQVTQHNVTLIVRKAQNPIFISAVFCLRYCQSRKGSKLNNWELIAPAKRLNQNCDA